MFGPYDDISDCWLYDYVDLVSYIVTHSSISESISQAFDILVLSVCNLFSIYLVNQFCKCYFQKSGKI